MGRTTTPGLDLPLEPPEGLRRLDHIGQQDFQGHPPLYPPVLGLQDQAHAALAQLVQDHLGLRPDHSEQPGREARLGCVLGRQEPWNRGHARYATPGTQRLDRPEFQRYRTEGKHNLRRGDR